MKRIIFILVLILIIGAAVYAFIEGNNETAKDEAARITQSADTINTVSQTGTTNQFTDDDSPYRAVKWVFDDSDIYQYKVDYKHEYRDKLQEHRNKGLPVSTYWSGKGYDHFADEYIKDKSKYVDPEVYTINRTMQLKSYDITERSYEYEKGLYKPGINPKTGKLTESVFDVRKYRDYLEVLTDGDTLVWVSSKSAVMDAKKLANDRYMVLTDTLVAYVGFENERRYAIVYDKLHLSLNKWRAIWGTDNKERIKYDPRKCGKILTENIYRIECPDGTIIHYKVKLTLQDMENNLKIQKYDKPRIDASVIWLSVPVEKDVNGRYVGGLATSTGDIAWDFNPDYSKEPVYTE